MEVQRQVHGFCSKAADKLLKGKANMARAIGIEGIVLGISAMVVPAAPAAAQSVGGAMGPTSQAEIRISIRVMPRFTFQSKAVARDAAKADQRSLTVSANAPTLRYAVVPQPAASSRTATDRLLVLVVPD
jgi:hypothetical protein